MSSAIRGQSESFQPAANRDDGASLTPENLAVTRIGGSAPLEPPEIISEASIPTQLRRFLVKQSLGEGGFGAVYLANDPDLNRPVAIKFPKQERRSGRGLTA